MALGDYQKVKCHACIGDTAVKTDLQTLSEGVHCVVGTPGCVIDIIRLGALNTRSMKMCVLDEADEMMSRGFKDQIYDVFTEMAKGFQVNGHYACNTIFTRFYGPLMKYAI